MTLEAGNMYAYTGLSSNASASAVPFASACGIRVGVPISAEKEGAIALHVSFYDVMASANGTDVLLVFKMAFFVLFLLFHFLCFVDGEKNTLRVHVCARNCRFRES